MGWWAVFPMWPLPLSNLEEERSGGRSMTREENKTLAGFFSLTRKRSAGARHFCDVMVGSARGRTFGYFGYVRRTVQPPAAITGTQQQTERCRPSCCCSLRDHVRQPPLSSTFSIALHYTVDFLSVWTAGVL